jgi:hypothetical protein
MTPEEWAHMLRLAAGVFGDNRLVDDPDAAAVWYASLKRFHGRVVFAAFTKLAEMAERFPALAQVIEGCRLELDRQHREERDAQPRLNTGRRWPQPAVDLPEGYVIGPASATFARLNAEPGGWTPEKLRRLIREAGLPVPEPTPDDMPVPLGGKDRALPASEVA